MKKILALVLALGLIFSLAACTKTAEDEALTLGGTLKKQFIEIAKSGETDPVTIANALMENELIQFMPMVTEVDPGTYLQGFTVDEIEGYDKCSMFGPMIGSIPFIGYIFSLSDGVEADDFIENLTENADLRWNICVSADEVHTANEGSTVFFLMSPVSLEQETPNENQEEFADEPIDEIPMDAPAADDAPAVMPAE